MALKTGNWRAFRNIPVFWIHQRTTNLDRSELIFHITLNLFAAIVIFFILSIIGIFSVLWQRIFIALILTRTFSWILNDHFWGGLQVSFSFVKNCGEERFCQYLIDVSKRLSECNAIYACFVYGSLVRNEFHRKSDLDVLYIKRSGFISTVSALSFAVRERVIALFARIPLDLYVGDSKDFLKRYRDDEIPIIIKDGDGSMVKKYPKHIPLEKFLQNFKHNKDGIIRIEE